MSASEKPRSSITSARRQYMTPMRLWSTLVIHSRHKYGSQPLIVIQARTARITTPTTPPAARGIGWSQGTASQVSLPNRLPNMLVVLRTREDAVRAALGPRPGRDLLRDDLLEEPGVDLAVGEGGDLRALPGELGVAPGIEDRAVLAGGVDPGGEVVLRDGPDLEVHVREPVAAHVGRDAVVAPGLVGLQVQLRGHPVHGV